MNDLEIDKSDNSKKKKVIKKSNIANWIVTIIATLAAAYSIFLAEFGPINKAPDINLFVHDKIRIGQHYGALFIDVPLHMRNVGNDIGSIDRMEAVLERENSRYKKNFKWYFSPLTLRPDEKLDKKLKFHEIIDREVANQLFFDESRLRKELYDEFYKNPTLKLYTIKSKLVKEIKTSTLDRLKGFTAGNYKITFKAYADIENTNSLFWEESFNFNLFESNIVVLKDSQLEFYNSHPDFNVHYYQFAITPTINSN